MSSLLWKFYLEDDVDQFRRLLADARYVAGTPAVKGAAGTSSAATVLSSSAGNAGHLASSPRTTTKHRKFSGWAGISSTAKSQSQWSNLVITRPDINLRDRNGLTILHHAASSTSANAIAFATALLEHPLIDLYVQDRENGWTVLHRALYFGQITIARAIMDCDMRDAWGSKAALGAHHAGALIRIKDWEGNSPFDLLNATIAFRSLDHREPEKKPALEDEDTSDRSDAGGGMDEDDDGMRARHAVPHVNLNGNSLFTFGSNKNLNLGLGDEDDRQFPELVFLSRPDHLLYRFYYEHQQRHGDRLPEKTVDIAEAGSPQETSSLPSLIQNRPMNILNVVLSKLHTAVLTDDPEANLYICGFGSGGRLGTGDETTRFNLTCIEGGGLAGKKVVNVGLGQNHTLAITSEGEIFSWGANNFGQLGYALPKTTRKDDDPVQTSPRQIFGPLKREIVVGAAASRIHSVVHTSAGLFTFGKNEGQLGLVDSDARSLEAQVVPRRVAASLFASPIEMIAAIDHATICLLADHEVWVFANYGYAKLSFQLESFTNYFLRGSAFSTRYDALSNHISKVSAGGDTICAMTRSGDVFTVNVSQKLDAGMTASSTTNPNKIRNALSSPQRIWSLRKGHMAVRDVDVGQDGSVIICTESGSVWRRVKRAKVKDPKAKDSSSGTLGESKARDYKFSRIPGLTRVIAVRSNTFGAYAAVRRDCDVTRSQILVNRPELWMHVAPLLFLNVLGDVQERDPDEDEAPRFWAPAYPRDHFDPIKKAVLTLPDLEAELKPKLDQKAAADSASYDIEICTSVSEVVIPAHQFILTARSRVFRQGLQDFKARGAWSIPEVLTVQRGSHGRPRIQFQGFDFLTIFNLIFYVYRDDVIDVWQFTRHAPKSAYRYRQVRTELMKIAARLELRELEAGVRVMREATPRLDKDLEAAILDPTFFSIGDAVVELADEQVKVHSTFMCQRCPFFEGLFKGRAAGKWLSSRRDVDASFDAVTVDLKHVDSSTFKLVLRHLYCDTGEELFDDVVTADLDGFLDILVDVLSVANELMLDRLSQLCQTILGRFVTTRNACQLLNAVSSCSITEFKDACLEYLCLNLEAMLENHLLEELDDDLLLELDDVVRANQLACLPFAKSGRAESLLQEKFPELAEARDLERQDRISAVAVRSKMAEEDSRPTTSSSKFKAGSYESQRGSSPLLQKVRRQPSKESATQQSPLLRSKTSAAELIFDMDDDEGRDNRRASPANGKSNVGATSDLGESLPGTPRQGVERDSKSSALATELASIRSNPSSFGHLESPSVGREPSWETSDQTPTQKSPSTRPWAAPLSSSKLDMKEIMAQASSGRASSLSAGLSSQAAQQLAKVPSSSAKLSQKERKKMRQQQQQQQTSPSPRAPSSPLPAQAKDTGKRGSPWQVSASAAKVSLREVLGAEEKRGATPRHVGSPKMDLMEKNKSAAQQSQQRSISNPIVHRADPPRNSPIPATITRPQPSQHRHSSTPNPPLSPPTASSQDLLKAEPTLQLSMADIIHQQQAEQAVIKQTIARRPLQDIQQEQEFMEWWDAESKRALQEEQQTGKTSGTASAKGKGGKRRGKAGGKSGVGAGGAAADTTQSTSAPTSTSTSSPSIGADKKSREPTTARGGHASRGGGGRKKAATDESGSRLRNDSRDKGSGVGFGKGEDGA